MQHSSEAVESRLGAHTKTVLLTSLAVLCPGICRESRKTQPENSMKTIELLEKLISSGEAEKCGVVQIAPDSLEFTFGAGAALAGKVDYGSKYMYYCGDPKSPAVVECAFIVRSDVLADIGFPDAVVITDDKLPWYLFKCE